MEDKPLNSIGVTKLEEDFRDFMSHKVPFNLKGKFYLIMVRPAILYGTECWAVMNQRELDMIR